MNGNAFNDVILAQQTLGDVHVEKRDESKRPERFWYEYVDHFAEFGKVLKEIFGGYIFGDATDKYFGRRNRSFL